VGAVGAVGAGAVGAAVGAGARGAAVGAGGAVGAAVGGAVEGTDSVRIRFPAPEAAASSVPRLISMHLVQHLSHVT
jgi:hypothetical protein